MEVVKHPTKLSVDINDHLYDLGNNFSLHIDEVFAKQPNTRYLCSLTHDSGHAFTLRWAHSIPGEKTEVKLEDLKNISFDNNLESLIDYTTPVTTVITIIFATLECVRRYYETESVFFVKSLENNLNADIYI